MRNLSEFDLRNVGEPKSVLIGPSVALELLGKNHNPRAFRKRKVAEYAEIMRRGQWVLSNDAIVLDENGDLVNGQHRLQAVVDSETFQRFIMVCSSEPLNEGVMDCGLRRSDLDRLGNCKLGNTALAACKQFYCQPYTARVSTWPTFTLREAVEKSGTPVAWATELLSSQGSKMVRAPLIAGLARASDYLDNDVLVEMATTLVDGSGVGHTATITRRFRDWIQSSCTGTRRLDSELYKKWQRVAVAVANTERITKIRMLSQDLFPVIESRRIARFGDLPEQTTRPAGKEDPCSGLD